VPAAQDIPSWAESNRKLTHESAAEAGYYSLARTPYLREPLRAFDDGTNTVVLMFASQTGKTEACLSLLGYHVAADPCPILLLLPNIEFAKQFAKDRLQPLFANADCFEGIIEDPKRGDKQNTLLHRSFVGGRLTLAPATTATALASKAIRLLVADEIDRFEHSAGIEGDPVDLAIQRTVTFAHSRRILLTSTPTLKGVSRIEKAFADSRQAFFQVPCPNCEAFQVLKWSNVRWQHNEPDTAHYVCQECETSWTEGQRLASLQSGKWVEQYPHRKTKGYHLSGLYSPWVSLVDAVTRFLEVKSDPERLKVWTNVYLAETWEDQGETIDEHGLYNRREVFKAPAPSEVLVITAGIDVQDDRLEVTFLGTGKNNEGFVLDHQILHSDPAAPQTWLQLDKLLKERWRCADGHGLPVQAACIDSGGHFTQAVYEFVRSRTTARIYAIKGVGGEGKPPIGRPSRNNSGRIKLFPVGVDTIKQAIFGRLRIASGPEALRFPKHLDEEYFAQLTAEKIVTRYTKGFPRREWIKIRPRNEALDCLVYALAALSSLNIRDWKRLERTAKVVETVEESVAQPEPQPQRRTLKPSRRPQSWIQRF